MKEEIIMRKRKVVALASVLSLVVFSSAMNVSAYGGWDKRHVL